MPFRIFLPEKEEPPGRKIAIIDRRVIDSTAGFGANQYNLALGYIGKALLNDGHKVMILQKDPKTESDKELTTILRDFDPDFYCFGTCSYLYDRTLKFKRRLENQIKSKKIFVIGGIHASTTPEECSKEFDYVVVGEGEETIRELVNSLNKSQSKGLERVLGLAFQSKGHFVFTGKRPRMPSLDKYGFPLRLNFSLANSGIVPPYPDRITGFVPIIFGRGCEGACIFCTNKEVYGSGKKAHVSRDPVKIAEEITTLFSENGINYFWTHDEDMLAYNPLEELCEELILRKSKGLIGQVCFGGMGGIHHLFKGESINSQLIKKLAQAGCTEISFGIERATNQELRKLGKGITTNQVQRVLQAVFDEGISPVGLFMYGFDNETNESLRSQIEYAKHLPIIRYRFSPVYPLKGTVYREYVDSYNLWLDKKFKEPRFATMRIPVIKNKVTQTTKEEGYKSLASFGLEACKEIYGSQEYAARVRKFIERTGERFTAFFNAPWRNYVRNRIGAEPKW